MSVTEAARGVRETVSDLERRYLFLVRFWYPPDHWLGRGRELVGTYLDLAAPGRRWPSASDAADLAKSGIRQHLRATGAAALAPGFRLAGLLALLTATVLAAVWTLIELRPVLGDPATSSSGLGAGVWAVWLLAGVIRVVAFRWARSAIAVSVLVTVLVLPFAAVTGLPRPPVFVLLPQVALGILALAAPRRVPLPWALLPLVTGATAATLVARMTAVSDYYGSTPTRALAVAGTGLLVVATLGGAALGVRGDHRGAWALLVLATPIGLLSLHPLARAFDGGHGAAPHPDWPALALVALLVTVIGPALVPFAVAARRRTARAD